MKTFKEFVIGESRFPNVMSMESIVDEAEIYQYVEAGHHTHDDFIDGDLGDRIEKYSQYKLMDVSINDIDIDEFYVDEGAVEDYQYHYASGSEFPPIVLNSDLSIIDGIHRVNAAYKSGLTSIKAYVGI